MPARRRTRRKVARCHTGAGAPRTDLRPRQRHAGPQAGCITSPQDAVAAQVTAQRRAAVCPAGYSTSSMRCRSGSHCQQPAERAVGSARSTRPSSIACAKSSRMPPPPASVGAGPSGPPPAAVPAATSLASRPPRIAIRAQRPGTWKKPRNRGLLAAGPCNSTLQHLVSRVGVLPPTGAQSRGLRVSPLTVADGDSVAGQPLP